MQPIQNSNQQPKQQWFHVGQNLDVLDSVNKWMNAEVRFVGNGTIYIHYTGFSAKYDQSVPITSSRILRQWQPGKQIKLNNRIDVYHPIGGWLQARVIQKEQKQNNSEQTMSQKVFVHFFNYHKKYDIWVDVSDSDQVAIIGSKSKAHGMGKNRKKQAKLNELIKKLLEEKAKLLGNKLQSKNMTVKQTGGDGNCLFRSISDQLYGTEAYYAQIRKFCMDYISYEKNFFQDYISEDIDEYIETKRKDGEWGDDVQIQALSEIYSRPIEIFVFDDVPIRTFHEDNASEIEPLRLNYVGACHYNSIKYNDKLNEGLLSSQFGEFQQIFFSTYKTSNMEDIVRNRNLFSFSNRIEDTVQQRLQAQKREQTKIQNQLNKVLQLSETEAILQQIQNAELQEFQIKYEQEKLQEELKKLEEKEIQEAKKISQEQGQKDQKAEQSPNYHSEKPYWFDDLKSQGFSDELIWFAIEVKGYDPDAVQNFLLDNLCM